MALWYEKALAERFFLKLPHWCWSKCIHIGDFSLSMQDIKSWTLCWSFIPKADKILKMEGHHCPRNPSPTRKHLKRQTVEREDSVCFGGNGPFDLIGADHLHKQKRTLRTSVFLHRGAELSRHTYSRISVASLWETTLHCIPIGLPVYTSKHTRSGQIS